MNPYQLIIRVDYLPKTQTDVMQKFARRTYREKLKALVRSKVVSLPSEPIQRAALRCTRFSSVQPDYDGLVAGFKTVIDSLQPDKRFAGVIVNDRATNLCGFEGPQQEYRWVKHPPFGGYIMVELMEVEG